MPAPTTQTFTPSLIPYADKRALVDEFVGRKLSSLRTPALIVDRVGFARNCDFVTGEIKAKGLGFRAHIKTHKTAEGVRLQVAPGVSALVTSTLPEVWGVLESGLVAEGKVTDILYSLPVAEDRLEDLTDAQEKAGDNAAIRVMVDHAEQVAALARGHAALNRRHKWSVFVKVDGGAHRAGAPPRSAQMKDLVEALIKASDTVEVFGFYSHFGNSYKSTNLDEAGKYYAGEIECVNDAAKYARELGLKGEWTLSVGATPTAHAAALGAATEGGLAGTLEVHAGCYCMNDLQQSATGLVKGERTTALTVLGTVVSKYADRAEGMCDIGALAVSKDQGPIPGHGGVVTPGLEGWSLGRISQEHGTLVKIDKDARELQIGERLRVVPQHACLACANFPWFYVVDGDGDTVVDVWVPWRAW